MESEVAIVYLRDVQSKYLCVDVPVLVNISSISHSRSIQFGYIFVSIFFPLLFSSFKPNIYSTFSFLYKTESLWSILVTLPPSMPPGAASVERWMLRDGYRLRASFSKGRIGRGRNHVLLLLEIYVESTR